MLGLTTDLYKHPKIVRNHNMADVIVVLPGYIYQSPILVEFINVATTIPNTWVIIIPI